MRVMIVDDSVVFRSQIKNCLEGAEGITVAATAPNGKIALAKLEHESCDLVILDLEMPEMNGLEFLAEFRKRKFPQRVIVFAAPTAEGTSRVFDALKAGANDFVSKPAAATTLENALEGIKKELLPKIIQFERKFDAPKRSSPASESSQAKIIQSTPVTGNKSNEFPKVIVETFKPRIIVVGSSTGGPSALEILFSVLKGKDVKIPILVAQHMPPRFTEELAKRLAIVSGLPAAEGKTGTALTPGQIYVAPGDYHMSIQRLPDSGTPIIKLDQAPKRNSVRPAVDFLFETAAREYGNSCAGFILTGMGEDGKDGALAIKRQGGAMMIQDRESSVVWGMPGSVHAVGAYDSEGSIQDCAKILGQMVV